MPDFKLGQKVGLAARRASVEAKTDALTSTTPVINLKTLKPEDMPDRIGIVFDDSGSMSGSKITDAHAGVEEFLRNCKPAATAVAIYPMCASALRASCDLIALAIMVRAIEATGGTPLIATLDKMIEKESLTRAIVFSDGQPNNPNYTETARVCKEKKIPVDTVYIGSSSEYGAEKAILFMQSLAEATGGIFMHFDPAKMNFRNAFKYLAPTHYGMLGDKSVVADIEAGRK